jgi:hypothetical protein
MHGGYLRGISVQTERKETRRGNGDAKQDAPIPRTFE